MMNWRDGGRWCGVAVIVAALGGGVATTAYAQAANPNRNPRAAQLPREVGAAEVERLFGAYAAIQAQDALSLDDAQFARFLPRMKALQAVRRRVEVERNRITGELARLTAPGMAATCPAACRPVPVAGRRAM